MYFTLIYVTTALFNHLLIPVDILRQEWSTITPTYKWRQVLIHEEISQTRMTAHITEEEMRRDTFTRQYRYMTSRTSSFQYQPVCHHRLTTDASTELWLTKCYIHMIDNSLKWKPFCLSSLKRCGVCTLKVNYQKRITLLFENFLLNNHCYTTKPYLIFSALQ